MKQNSKSLNLSTNMLTKPNNSLYSEASSSVKPHSLFDLMYDGFYALYQLRNGAIPEEMNPFRQSIVNFISEFEREAKSLSLHPEDIEDAKYAFCASVDELVLRSSSPIRTEWELKPLQLTLFGDQLAGEHFFDKLEYLRARGQTRVQALEIYHMCLLLGFQGKYLLDSSEKLHYLTARVGDEVAAHKGGFNEFAPQWQRPDHFTHQLRHEVPIWFIGGLFAFVAVLAFSIMSNALNQSTQTILAPYNEIIEIAPKAANIMITLP